jgi:hypothetical protein
LPSAYRTTSGGNALPHRRFDALESARPRCWRDCGLKLARANIGDIRVTDERSVVNSNGNSKRIAEFRWSKS